MEGCVVTIFHENYPADLQLIPEYVQKMSGRTGNALTFKVEDLFVYYLEYLSVLHMYFLFDYTIHLTIIRH